MRKLFLSTLLLASVAALFVSSQASSSTLTVDGATGNDAGNCVSQPCKTIQRASDLAQPGDTVLIRDGNYQPFSVTRSGANGALIVFQAQNKQKAHIAGQVKSYGKSFITFRGLDLRMSSGNIPANAFDVLGTGSDITIEDSAVYSPSGSCVAIWGTPWQQDPGKQNYRGLQRIRIYNNKLIKCNNGGSNEGITVANGVDLVEIIGNEVGDYSGDVANGGNGGEGIDVKAGVTNVKIYKNHVFNRPHICIYADGGGAIGYYATAPLNTNIDIGWNTVENCNDTAIQLATEAAGNVTKALVHDNIVNGTRHGFGVLVYRHPSAPQWAKPLPPGCVTNSTIKDNRITGAANGPTRLDSACTPAGSVVFTNNGANVVPAPYPGTAPPTVDLVSSDSDNTIDLGQSVTLSWSSTNASSCQAQGGWTSITATAGSAVVTPSASAIFKMNCSGSGGTASDQISITVNEPIPPPPEIDVPALISHLDMLDVAIAHAESDIQKMKQESAAMRDLLPAATTRGRRHRHANDNDADAETGVGNEEDDEHMTTDDNPDNDEAERSFLTRHRHRQ